MTIIIADDHPLFRDAMAKKLAQQNDPDIIEAGSFSELESVLETFPAPDILILDLQFPGLDSLSKLVTLKNKLKRTALIIVSMNTDAALVQAVMATGVDGYISKNVPPEQLLSDIADIQNGNIVVNYIPGTLPNLRVTPAELDLLTERQREVLQLLVQGKSNKQIAQSLNISPFTVRIHVSQVLHVLGVPTRTVAIAQYSHLI
ncbi:response regulator transcription factor [Enterobacter sp. 638]|uniref:Two component transcriptional regulator, LuxR family n=1 Tax=Enterobacter sp. (strain 638) TaxID=399742 RepID=A0A9J9GJR1_ENT38|nr:response regulator transcription factor [Enterobacter sp. 638]ABP62809.1 two component transcriptional regulator, LuxR family [Enterobacter sp. 638]